MAARAWIIPPQAYLLLAAAPGLFSQTEYFQAPQRGNMEPAAPSASLISWFCTMSKKGPGPERARSPNCLESSNRGWPAHSLPIPVPASEEPVAEGDRAVFTKVLNRATT